MGLQNVFILSKPLKNSIDKPVPRLSELINSKERLRDKDTRQTCGKSCIMSNIYYQCKQKVRSCLKLEKVHNYF